MSRSKWNLVAVFVLAVTVSACGGGSSGDDSDSSFFGGLWRIFVSTVENTCGKDTSPVGETFDFTVTVEQNGNMVVVNEDGTRYEGTTTGDSSFSASAQFTEQCVDENDNLIPGSFVNITERYVFSDISGGIANVEFTVNVGNCSGNTDFDSSCRIVELGTGELQNE